MKMCKLRVKWEFTNCVNFTYNEKYQKRSSRFIGGQLQKYKNRFWECEYLLFVVVMWRIKI